jgi:hypothetical protein
MPKPEITPNVQPPKPAPAQTPVQNAKPDPKLKKPLNAQELLEMKPFSGEFTKPTPPF